MIRNTRLSAYKAFKDKGGVGYVLTAEKAQFVESVQPLKQWYVDKFGDKWLKMLEASIAQAEKEIAAETSGSPTESFFAR